MIRNIYKHLVSWLVFSSILLSATASFGQKARSAKAGSVAAASKKTPCAGGWSGVVSYKRTLRDSLNSDEPGIRSNIDRIKHVTSRNYEYSGRAVVIGTDPRNPTVNAKVNFTDADLNWGEERVFDTCNSTESGHWFVIEGTNNRKTEAKASGPAQSFDLNVDELGGTYRFSMQLPKAQGTFNNEEHVKKSGHCQPQNNLPFDRSTTDPFTIDEGSFSVDDQKIDPKDPDHLIGTKVWGDDGTGPIRTFINQVTWTFARCQAILVTDVKFEDMKFPEWNAWKEVTENESTIDGNRVRITAKVVNLSADQKFVDVKLIETFKGDKYDGARKDRALSNELTVRLDPGEEREVESFWNTEGYAWYDDGRPRPVQRVRAEAWESEKLRDSRTENIRIAPKPLILVPGMWTDRRTLALYQNLLTVTHSYDWKAAIFAVRPRSGGIRPSVYDTADDLAEFIDATQKAQNAWHVDIVAHSTGGLVGRLFIHKSMKIQPDERPTVKHFLMLGTPNLGVPCPGAMKFTDAFDDNPRTVEEIAPDAMETFNRYVTERKGTRFSSLVGNGSQILCTGWVPGDGFASIESARWMVSDVTYTSDGQVDLIEPKQFNDFIKPHLITGPMDIYPLMPGVRLPGY